MRVRSKTETKAKKPKRSKTSRVGKAAVQSLAHDVLGLEQLRLQQEEAVLSVLAGHDTLVVMPTGAGKSAIYQLAALALEGPTVVVSPLIALQYDQVERLEGLDQQTQKVHSEAAALNSSLSKKGRFELLKALANGKLEFLFLAPEQLGTDGTLAHLREAKPSLFVVDEAHCVAEWGHDFRPEYRQLKATIEALDHPTVLALTATAAPPVRKEITKSLGMQDAQMIVGGFDRPNLELVVEAFVEEDEKRTALIKAVIAAEKPGIVYTATRKHAEEVAEALKARGVNVAPYHAGLSKKEREAAQNAFTEDELEVVVATIAFGMGINKPNVRFVFHLDISGSVDAYYQEIGRAGRDGEKAQVKLFYRPEDLKLQRFFAGGSGVAADQLGAVAQHVDKTKKPLVPMKLKDEVGLSDTKLLTALNRLEEVGALELTPEGEVVPNKAAPGPTEAAEAAVRAQEHFKMYERSRLEMIEGYAETTECRREYLLNYFGEPFSGPCGNCDICLAESDKTQAGGERANEQVKPFPTGSRVAHRSFGEGQVMRYEDAKVTVLFDEVGYQTLSLEIVVGGGLLEPVG